MSLLLLLLAPALAQPIDCQPLDAPLATERAWSEWRTLGAERALEPLENAWSWRDIACAPPSPESLARMAQVAGTIAHFGELPEAAEAWFLRALEVAPTLPFGDDLGSEPRAIYEALRSRPAPPMPQPIAPLPLAPPSPPAPDRRLGLAVGGVGLALLGGGAALWSATLNGPAMACDATDRAYDTGPSDLRLCQKALDNGVYTRWQASALLLSAGGTATAVGLTFTLAPGAFGLSGRW